MAPSQTGNDVIGALGGAVLAACLLPQCWRLYKTRSAFDLAYGYLVLYATGLSLTFVYLFFEGATVAWICMLVEVVFCVGVIAAKFYLDGWGPYSTLGKSQAVAAAAAAAAAAASPGGSLRGGRDCVIALHADGSAHGSNFFYTKQAGEIGKAHAALSGADVAAAADAKFSSSSGDSSGSTRKLLLEVELPLPAAGAGAGVNGGLGKAADGSSAAAPAGDRLDAQQLVQALQAALLQQIPGGQIRALPQPVAL